MAAVAVVEMIVFLRKKCFDFEVCRAQQFCLLVLTLSSTSKTETKLMIEQITPCALS